jgi:hypothetical protein
MAQIVPPLDNTKEKQMDQPVMLKCGCAAHARKKVGDDWVPSCITHNCTEQVEAPSLAGRIARCDCGNTQPSSLKLAFFEFKGDGSREATEKCKCGAIDRLHLPYWEARIKVVRRWFKIERSESIAVESIHAADEAEARVWAEAYVQKWWKMGSGAETKVNEVELLSLKSMPRPRYHIKVCSTFTPAGAAQFDGYYCGHSGWN